MRESKREIEKERGRKGFLKEKEKNRTLKKSYEERKARERNKGGGGKKKNSKESIEK